MNCHYCKEPCQLIQTETSASWEQWVCRRHAHLVTFSVVPTATACHYSAQYKGRGYVVVWYKSDQGEQWSLSAATDTKNGIPQSNGELIETQFIPPNITPDTIDKKLPLLLPFL